MVIDQRVLRRYEVFDEDGRLWLKGRGDLIRLRTWDLFSRLLPRSGRVLDVGGGTGTHAAHLAGLGYDVALIDPVPCQVARAAVRSNDQQRASFQTAVGEACGLPFASSSIDVVLLMGPLYHLIDRDERLAALDEAMRVLRPGGRLLAETITRHSYLMSAAVHCQLDQPDIWRMFERNIGMGLSRNPATMRDGDFLAHLHTPLELGQELHEAGFVDPELFAVEGFGWLLGDLEGRMAEPGPLLQALRLTEREPSMLGVSAHMMALAHGRRR
ncbi:MAG: class I SAM-dependent methyltransferase [Acidimicrobiales bacterium]